MADHIILVGLKDRSIFSPEAGLSRQILAYGRNLMLVRHRMKKGWTGARHSHPHEQLVYMTHGHIQFHARGITFDARTGDSFVVPGGVEHQASAIEDSEVPDIFTPVREDYVES